MQRVAGWARTSRAARVLVVALAVLGAGGCQVQTAVRVDDNPNGSGTVTVSVTLDQAADAAIGGLAEQLQTTGLAAEGWMIGAPMAVAGGGSTVTATHPFSSPAQLVTVLATIAGTPGHPLFRMAVSRTHSLWRDDTTLTGGVDLTCGIGCFGDQALEGSTGSSVGFDPAALATQAGVTPAQAFHFQVQVALPGTVTSTNASARPGGRLEWQPQLGHHLTLAATTRTWNSGAILTAVVAAAAVVVVAVVLVAVLWRRRRRRRRSVSGGAQPSAATAAGD